MIDNFFRRVLGFTPREESDTLITDYNRALKFIYHKKSGTFTDLRKRVTKELIDSFISVGFIICGYTPSAKTWKISTLGKEYCKDFVL